MPLTRTCGQHEGILPVLYDLALVIGNEISLKPLLTRFLQRLLYHTSFPAGFICLDLPAAGGEPWVEATLHAAVGDYILVERVDREIRLPASLLGPEAAAVADAAEILSRLPIPTGRYNSFLRLPIDESSVVILLAPRLPATDMPVTRMFVPVMAHLAKAILLCRSYDSQRRAADAHIEYLANHDALTGLPNRAFLRGRAEHAMAAAAPGHRKVALLYIDIDNFKMVNDSLDHARGDDLLKAVARRLRDCLQEADTVCRQGADEYLVLLDDLEEGAAAAIAAEKILSSLAESVALGGGSLSISATVGISLYPDDGRDFETLLRNADTALRYGKAHDRGSFRFFTDAMDRGVRERFALESRLHGALERGEFLLHYQPQVDLRNGRVIGAESLIRWQTPDMGLVPPGRFIPVAEQSGAIVAIGAWVLEESCRQAARWRAAGLPLEAVAVNLSAVQFSRGNIVATVRRALADSGLPPACLELELTESILIHDTEQALAAVHDLKALGVRLSLDDFGTGYSSLSYLTRFPVDKLKIDQSFVRELEASKEAAKIVRIMIDLGRGLGLKIIAEGIETPRQSLMLQHYGCGQGQGYYYGRPVPADEFPRFFEQEGGGVLEP